MPFPVTDFDISDVVYSVLVVLNTKSLLNIMPGSSHILCYTSLLLFPYHIPLNVFPLPWKGKMFDGGCLN